MLRYFFDVTIWEIWPLLAALQINSLLLTLICLRRPGCLFPPVFLKKVRVQKIQGIVASTAILFSLLVFVEFFFHEREYWAYWKEAENAERSGSDAYLWKGYCVKAQDRQLLGELRWAVLNEELAFLEKRRDATSLIEKADSTLVPIGVKKDWAKIPTASPCRESVVYSFVYTKM